MPTYLLIGPSGSGKSTAAEIIASKTDITVIDLDKAIKQEIGGESVSQLLGEKGDRYFFELSKSVIEKINHESTGVTLIVVGAGSINLDASHEWYKQQELISLVGNEEVLYERGNRKQHHPTLESYKTTEFKPARKNLYSNSKYQVDVTNSNPEQVADELIKIIKAS